MADLFLRKLYEKYYGNNTKKGRKNMTMLKVKAKTKAKDLKNKNIINETIATKEISSESKKKERQVKFKTRPNGVLRLSDKHMQKFGFKCKQELEIINNKPGEIIVKVKHIPIITAEQV